MEYMNSGPFPITPVFAEYFKFQSIELTLIKLSDHTL